MAQRPYTSAGSDGWVEMSAGNIFDRTYAMSLGNLFQQRSKFVVPKFQRNYSWDNEQAEELWNDLVENFQAYLKCITGKGVANIDEAQYLLGSVVLVESSKEFPGECIVVDGQQRLATLTILFCVMRDMLREEQDGPGDASAGSHEREKVIGTINDMIELKFSQNKLEPWKLVLNDTDKVAFEEIQAYEEETVTQYERIKKKLEADGKSMSKSERRIYKNYICIHELLCKALRDGFGSAEKAESNRGENCEMHRFSMESLMGHFLNHIRDNNHVVHVLISDDSIAYQVFETLNSRGQELAKSNLIKNHVLSKVANDDVGLVNTLSNRWNKVFDEVIGQKNHDEFILESMRSRLVCKNETKWGFYPLPGGISKRNIYKETRNYVTVENPKSPEGFIAQLEDDGEFVSTLNDPTTYSDNGDGTKAEINALNLLNAKLVRYPVLAAYRKWGGSNSNYSNLVRFLTKFFFKFIVVRRKHPGEFEKIMNKVTCRINNGDKCTDIISDVVEEHDDHDHFKAEFSVLMKEPKRGVAIYVLRKINEELETGQRDMQPIEDLTLEHVAPKKYMANWKPDEFFAGYPNKDSMSNFVKRLGNMTLLHGSINIKIKHSAFEVKKTKMDSAGNLIGYNGSKLAINHKTVCNEEVWNAAVIVKREKEFADHADKIWSLDKYKIPE